MKLNVEGIHIIEKKGINIVLDIESNSTHVFDKESLVVLNKIIVAKGEVSGIAFNEEEREILEELLSLKEQGMLFTLPAGQVPPMRFQGIKSICLNVAHDCNLACAYCFASQGDFGGKPSLMSKETGRKAVDFLIGNSGKRKLLEMDFFGGEPLMAMDTVKEVVRYGHEQAAKAGKVFKFSLTTNGVLLDQETIDYIVANRISLVLSLDGRKEVNDRMRYTKNHKPSYDLILPRYLELAEKTDDYVVRGTYTKHNLDFSEDVKSFDALGFKHLSIEPAVCSEDTDFALGEGDLELIQDEYARLAVVYLERYKAGHPIDFFHFNVDLSAGPCIYKRVTACGAGFEYLALTPEGDIYPCHQFVGQEEFKMGDLDHGIVDQESSDTFRQTNIYSKESCRSCWARYYCSGGCHANAQEFNQDIKKPYQLGCEIQKIRLEMAIFVQVMVSLYDKGQEGDRMQDMSRNDLYTRDKIKDLIKY